MKGVQTSVAIALSLLQTCTFLAASSPPAFGLPSNGAVQDSDEAQLASFEKVIFGEAHPQQPIETRLEGLESNLFGTAKQGSSTHTRLSAIGRELNASKVDVLSPPLAPQYDFSHPKTAQSTTGNRNNNDYRSTDGLAKQQARYDTSQTTSDSDTSGGASPKETAQLALQHATMLYSKGRTVEAEYAFKHVLTLDNHCTDAYFNLGVISETKGDLQAALGYYQRATALNPHDPELADAVRAVQTKISSQIASANRAQQQQQQAQQLSQDEGKRQQLKQLASEAQTAYKSGNFDKAINNLRTVAAQAPDDPDVQFALAQAYKGKGDFGNARNSLGRALSMDPNNQLYQTAMNDLSNRSGGGNGNQRRNYQGSNGNAPMPGGSLASQGTADMDNTASLPPPSNIPYQPTDQFASSTPQSGWQSASSNAPSGQLTPFTSQGESSLPGGASMHRGGVLGNGFYSHSGGGYSTKTRLTRVAIGSAAGLAAGAMFGMGGGGHRMGRSMLGGALIGGAFGLLGGW